jgi:hypothetical protein
MVWAVWSMLDAGFDSHLTKPVAYADLQRVLDRQEPESGVDDRNDA